MITHGGGLRQSIGLRVFPEYGDLLMLLNGVRFSHQSFSAFNEHLGRCSPICTLIIALVMLSLGFAAEPPSKGSGCTTLASGDGRSTKVTIRPSVPSKAIIRLEAALESRKGSLTNQNGT